MNFNASRNVGQPGRLRKAKRVSDVNAMGATSPPPGFGPVPQASFPPGFGPASSSPYPPGFAPTGPPPPYQEGIHLDGQDFGAASPAQPNNYGFAGAFMQSPPNAAQLGSMINQPIIQDMAYNYGNQLAAQGREVVQREINKYVPVSRLRYYFAVDTRYVLKKLILILFPYTHKEWMVKYDQNTPVQPRDDINAPDLYLPCMGYVTYVLLAGFMLGLQHRFSPEQIGIQASSALAYIIFEMILYLVTLYITNTSTNLKTLDLLAFSGYKYTTMIGSLMGGLILGKTGYYCMLVYSSVALSYFLVKTLRLQLLSGSMASDPQPPSYGYQGNPYANPYTDQWSKPTGTKRRVYFLLFVAITQPLLSWWLTYHLIPSTTQLPPTLPLTPAR